MLSDRPHHDNVYSNLPYYIKPLDYPSKAHPIPRDVFGEDYHPTSVSVFTHEGKVVHNVRFVNYVIQPQTGSYLMKEDGVVRENSTVRTQNAFYNPATGEIVKMRDDSVQLARKPGAHIVGLEDVRVYRSKDGTLSCTATTWEYTDKIRIFQARYNPVQGLYSDCRILDSPGNQECEKNWLPVNGTNDIIYRWSPLEIGRFEGQELKIIASYGMPWMFQHFRGSAVPVRVGNELWALVHFVEYSTPRKYFHCFVAMNPTNYKPTRVSCPFVFRQKTIEYCLGVTIKGTQATCYVSTMDDSPVVVEFDITQLSWFYT
jgi:hypothetical protein